LELQFYILYQDTYRLYRNTCSQYKWFWNFNSN